MSNTDMHTFDCATAKDPHAACNCDPIIQHEPGPVIWVENKYYPTRRDFFAVHILAALINKAEDTTSLSSAVDLIQNAVGYVNELIKELDKGEQHNGDD